MKARLFLLTVISIFALSHSVFAGIWTQVNTSGFGDINNTQAGNTIVFNNCLYVGTDNTATGTQIWRYDGTTWVQVNTNGFGTADNRYTHGVATFNGYLYVATQNNVTGGQIWRTQGSGGPPYTDWTQVNVSGFGSASNISARQLIVYNGYLYAMTQNNSTGTQVWRTQASGSPPFTDWIQVNASGFTDVRNTYASTSNVFNGYLYVGTSNTSIGTQIWRTHASGGPPFTDWTQVNVSGFGDTGNDASYGLRLFSGYVYLATHNASTGTQVWRTQASGSPPFTDWTQVNASGFGDPNNTDSRCQVFTGYDGLYVSTRNTSTGTQIWRTQTLGGPSYTDWTQVNMSGFGDPNNNFSFMPVFNNTLYAATQNTVTGAQIWKLTEDQMKLFVADYNNISVETWAKEAAGNLAPTTQFGSRLKYPQGVAVDSNWIYVANSANQSIDVYPINATGNVLPTRSIKGSNALFAYPSGIAVDSSFIYVTGYNSIGVFPKNADGNVTPVRYIQGSSTNLYDCSGIALDANWIYVTNSTWNGSAWVYQVLVFPIGGTGNIAPTRNISGVNTSLQYSPGIAVDSSWIYVTSYSNNSIAVFPIGADGNVTPTRLIQGSSTTLSYPRGIAVDASSIYVASSWNSISVFPIGGTGNIAPTREINGVNTNLSGPSGVAVDASFIYVANNGSNTVGVFGINDSGNIAPTRLITGGNTTLGGPYAMAVDLDWMYVADANNASITVFPAGASGDVAPTRIIQGVNTTLSCPYGVAVDSNWIYVADDCTMGIAVFPIGTSGDVAPTRLITGGNTTFNCPLGISVDSNWIYVTDICNNSIAVFPINATGDVAPTRTIQGASTNLSYPWGIAVDSNWIYVANDGNASVSVFQKSSTGDVPPARIIQGAKTTLCDALGIAVDLNWIYVADDCVSAITIFPIGASGNVAPNRAIQGDLTTLQGPAGVAVSPPLFLDSAIYVSKDISCGGYTPCLQNIQNGIDSTLGPTEVKITQDNYIENIILDLNKLIFLRGGWDTNFILSSAYTAIQGTITITHGTIILENVILK